MPVGDPAHAPELVAGFQLWEIMASRSEKKRLDRHRKSFRQDQLPSSERPVRFWGSRCGAANGGQAWRPLRSKAQTSKQNARSRAWRRRLCQLPSESDIR